MAGTDPLEIRALSDVLHASGETYLKDGDYTRAAEFFRKSLDIRERIGEPRLTADTLADLGRVLMLLGEMEEAAERVRSALKHREDAGDSAGVADCHDILGNIARGQGRPDEAESHYGRALAFKQEAGDERGMATTLALYGILHNERGDYPAAEERYQAALAIFDRVGDREQVASLTNNLGNLYLRKGDPGAAATELEKARDLFEELGDPRGVGKCLNNLAAIYRALGKDSPAADSYRKALGLFEEIGDKRGAAISANNLAVIEQDFGRYREASEYHERSLELKREMGDRTGEAVSLGNLADIAFFRGEWERADRLHRQALAIQEEVGNRTGEARLRNRRARLRLVRGGREAAAREAATARRLGREVQSREIQAEALLIEVRLASAAGDTGGARRLLEEAEELGRAMRSRETEAAIRVARGEVLASEGEEEAASTIFDEASRAYKRLRRSFDLAGVELARGVSLARFGRGDRCIKPFARAEEILDGMGSSAHMLAPLRQALEILAKEHPGEGVELAEMGTRLAHRLGDSDAARDFQEALQTRESGGGENPAEHRLAVLSEVTRHLQETRQAEGVAGWILERVVEEVRADRGLLLLQELAGDGFQAAAVLRLEDPALTDAVRAAERAGESGETIRDFQGGGSAGSRSRLVVPFGVRGEEGVAGVMHLEASVGARGFSLADARFVSSCLAAYALFLRGGSPRESRDRVAVGSGNTPAAFSTIVGDSKRIREVFHAATRVAAGNATVLILGESGTGKELLARGIHDSSPRTAEPFVAVNCPSIPRDLLESELFGYEKGAFTGADSPKAGRLELADGGTLFLDEVADLSPPAQAKILRVLQERTFERLGGLETKAVDVRILAATSTDLAEAVRDRRFREDLYYRINVVPLVLPALRDRKEDIPALVDHFLAKYARPERPVRFVTPEALRRLTVYPWPGNIRELENAIQYAVSLMDGETLAPGDLPRTVRSHGGGDLRGIGSLRSELERVEKEIILEILEETGWNRSEAARRLGTHESKIRQRIRKYGLSSPKKSEESARGTRSDDQGFVDSDEH
ncbi:MAG: hypothetical protein CME07_02130 [Gemmatimonadetes bacterium]|nr:hypothetical protein [Gemmatimonadota bacterium]